jgi:GH15 family glucan-1,4-alpha-glucosidase
VDGTYRLPEYELGWLAGYEGSTPVRIGNAASGQRQLDVWGEVLAGLHLAREAGITAHEGSWDLQLALLDYLEGHWDEPETGCGRCAGRAAISCTRR